MAATPLHHGSMPRAFCHGTRQAPSPWPTWRPCNAEDRRGATTTEGSSRSAVGPLRSRRASWLEGSCRRTLHPRVARWGVLGRVVIRGPPPPNGTNPAATARGGPRGPRGGVPGRDRTRGHKARATHLASPATLDPRQHQIVWLSTVHRRRPVAPLANTWRLSSVE